MDTTGSWGAGFRLPAQAAPVDAPPPRTGDRRRSDRRGGDRRRGQAAVLHFRRATDRRMDGAQAEALLARRTLEQRVQSQPVVDLVARELAGPAVVEAAAPAPAPVLVRCPECGQQCERLWLVRHVVEAHPGWN